MFQHAFHPNVMDQLEHDLAIAESLLFFGGTADRFINNDFVAPDKITATGVNITFDGSATVCICHFAGITWLIVHISSRVSRMELRAATRARPYEKIEKIRLYHIREICKG